MKNLEQECILPFNEGEKQCSFLTLVTLYPGVYKCSGALRMKIGTTRKCTSVAQKCLIKKANEWNVQWEKVRFLGSTMKVSSRTKKKGKKSWTKSRKKENSWKMLYHDKVLRPNGKRISRQYRQLQTFALVHLYGITTRNTKEMGS